MLLVLYILSLPLEKETHKPICVFYSMAASNTIYYIHFEYMFRGIRDMTCMDLILEFRDFCDDLFGKEF